MATPNQPGTRKRAAAKRSTVKRPEPAAEKVNPPDTSGGEEEETPKTMEEQFEAALKEDKARIFTVSGGKTGKQIGSHTEHSSNTIKYLVAKQQLAIEHAPSLRKARKEVERLNGIIAGIMADARQSIVRPDNMPDFGGQSAVYKVFAEGIVDAVYEEGAEGVDRATIRNTLQRRCARMMPERVALYVVQEQDLDMDEDEVKRVIGLKDKVFQGDDKKNPVVQALVKGVNKNLRVGKGIKNMPASPFVTKSSGSRLTLDEKETVETVEGVDGFLNAVPKMIMPDILEHLLNLVIAIRVKATGNNPAFSDEAKGGAAKRMGHVVAVLKTTHRELLGETPTKEEKDAVKAAMKFAEG